MSRWPRMGLQGARPWTLTLFNASSLALLPSPSLAPSPSHSRSPTSRGRSKPARLARTIRHAVCNSARERRRRQRHRERTLTFALPRPHPPPIPFRLLLPVRAAQLQRHAVVMQGRIQAEPAHCTLRSPRRAFVNAPMRLGVYRPSTGPRSTCISEGAA